MRRLLTAGIGCVLVAGLGGGVALANEDRVLRDVVGAVEDVRRSTDDAGSSWVDVTLRTDDGEAVDARIAPLEVLERDEFRIAVGDRARLRVFADEDPAGVSRIRNLSTGQTLRLRCLRGEPIWNLREPARTGPGHGRVGGRAGRGPG